MAFSTEADESFDDSRQFIVPMRRSSVGKKRRNIKGLTRVQRRGGIKYNTKRPNKLRNLFNSVKSLFSNKDTDLLMMQTVYNRSGNTQKFKGRKKNSMRQRVLRSEALNRKHLLHERTNNNDEDTENFNSNFVQELELQNEQLQAELKQVKSKLKFAREKNILYKSLLDEANIGSVYLESRRHIKNLEKENVKPQDELPPSPERKVFPLLTSSPIRKSPTSQSQNRTSNDSISRRLHPAAPPPQLNYYNKYPSLPHTEALNKDANVHNVDGTIKEQSNSITSSPTSSK